MIVFATGNFKHFCANTLALPVATNLVPLQGIMFVTSYVSFYATNVDSHLMYVLQVATLASSCQSLLIYVQYPWKLSSNFMAPTILFQNSFHDNSGIVSSKHPHPSCTVQFYNPFLFNRTHDVSPRH